MQGYKSTNDKTLLKSMNKVLLFMAGTYFQCSFDYSNLSI